MSPRAGHSEQETLRAIEDLASGAAHHLNNFLSVVVGHLQLALGKTESPDVRRHLTAAERAAQDSAEIVRQLSKFAGAHLAPPILVDLNQLAGEVLWSTRPRWMDPRGGRIDVRLDASPVPSVAADASLLREVLTNLVLNAIDAMPSGGSITIGTWAAGDRVFCSVSDTGSGMSPDVQRRALEPFFTTKGVKSTGLGLSVNYGIIRGYGGELRLDSVEGHGTTATFHLLAAGPADQASVTTGRLTQREP